MNIKELFEKYKNEPLSSKASIDSFLMGLAYLRGYGYVTDIDAKDSIIYLYTEREEYMDDICVKYLCTLGFSYEDGIVYYT